MAEAQDTAEGVFEVPDFKLACGATLRPARLVWKAYGDASLPVCLHPTSFGARHADVEYNIGPGKALDTCRVRVIVPVRTQAVARALAHRQSVRETTRDPCLIFPFPLRRTCCATVCQLARRLSARPCR